MATRHVSSLDKSIKLNSFKIKRAFRSSRKNSYIRCVEQIKVYDSAAAFLLLLHLLLAILFCLLIQNYILRLPLFFLLFFKLALHTLRSSLGLLSDLRLADSFFEF